MKKLIYAVKKGWKPGVYMEWLDLYEQIEGFQNAQMRSFTYLEELEDANESIQDSLAYAKKQAEVYLLNDDYESDELIYEMMGGNNPFLENDSVSDNKEMDDYIKKDEYIEKTSSVEKKESYSDARLYNYLKIDKPENANSPWLEMLLACVGADKPFVSGNIYTGRYSSNSLYVALLYLILDMDKIFGEYFNIHDNSKDEREFIKREFSESHEFNVLRKCFSVLEVIDLNEIRYRNADFANKESNSRLVMVSRTYNQMKSFVKYGKHTIVDLYSELTNSKIYRKELLMISGPYMNPHIMEEHDAIEFETTMQQLVIQTKAISMNLKNVIIGQDEAINKFEKAYFHTEKDVMQSQKKRGPRNVYLFAGPPGVGKTFMAETFAITLGKPYRRFDMSGYSDQNCVDEIAGISTFWKSAKPGVLTSFVNENPNCILLFDEIEKAHATVIRLFLQILDEGICFDRFYDANISFENVIIIFTTNAGKQLYESASNENLTLLPDRVVIGALEKDLNQETKTPYFPSELVSRMSSYSIIMFNHLKADAIRKVIKTDTIKQIEATEKVYGYHMKKGSELLAGTVQFSAGAGTDARNASKLAGKVIDRELYKLLTLAEEKCGLDKKDSIEQIQWKVDFTGVSEEIKEFYFGEKNCIIAIYGQVENFICEYFQKNNVIIKATTDVEKFMEIIHKENVIMALIDYEYGLDDQENNLSIVFAQTEGKNVLRKMKNDGNDIPTYILFDENKYQYSEREKQELCNKGIVDFIDRVKLQTLLVEIYVDVCCLKAMETLSLRHQVLNYETRNEVDIEAKNGKIIFHNLKLEMAVDAEDKSFLLTDDLRPDKRWSDICVTQDVKKELTFFIDFLQNPKEYIRKGVRSPKGVLMYGPPGTGKTSLAKVVAAQSNINFLSFSADEMVQRGAEYVHYLFRVARKYAPAVFFIDEIDAIGVTRGCTSNSTLNALLTEMDGFKKVDNKPVFIMAATNLGGAIDPALARRFDRSFCVDLPDKKGRKWILGKLINNHSNTFAVSTEEIDSISERSIGMSPAALEHVIETALREGIRSDKQVDDSMLDEVFEKCHYGEEKEIDSIEEIRQTAYHEAGHALIQIYYGRKPDYLSVIARGNFGGYVLTTERDIHPTKEKLLQRICSSLGGRAAELEIGYGLTPGVAADLKSATKIATKMVCEYGMYENEVGIAFIIEEELHHYSKVQNLINQILAEQLKEARRIVDEHRDIVNRLVDAVMNSEQKYLTQKELLNVYKGEGDRS